VLDTLREIWDEPWLSVTTAKLGACSGLFTLLFLALIFDRDGFVVPLDSANLAFHEAGHPILGLLGPTLGLYGGTLMQLAVPLLVVGSFWRQRHAASVAVTGVWFFENLLNVARYMADARVRILPLAGGGEHDWFHIFLRWGVLDLDTTIAAVVRGLGWLGMAATWAWLVWRWRVDDARRRTA